MKVLMIAGEKVDNIVKVSKTLYESSIDITGIKYVDDITNYLNRGETFDRAIIFDKAYTLNDQDTSLDSIKSRVALFVDEVQSRMSRYNLVFCATDDEIGLGIVEVTLNIGSNAIVISQGTQKVNKTFLSSLIATSMDNFRNKYKILDMNDLRKYQIENTRQVTGLDDTVLNDEPGIIDEVAPVNSNYDPFGGDDPFGNEDDPFNMGGGDTDPFNMGDAVDFGNTGFGEDDPFNMGDYNEEPSDTKDKNLNDDFGGSDPFIDDDPFGSEDDPFNMGDGDFNPLPNTKELVPPTFIDRNDSSKGKISLNDLHKDDEDEEESAPIVSGNPWEEDEEPIAGSTPIRNEDFNTDAYGRAPMMESLDEDPFKTNEDTFGDTDPAPSFEEKHAEDPFQDAVPTSNSDFDPFEDEEPITPVKNTASAENNYNPFDDEEPITPVKSSKDTYNPFDEEPITPVNSKPAETYHDETALFEDDENSIGAVEDIQLDDVEEQKPVKGHKQFGRQKQEEVVDKPVATKGKNTNKVLRLKERLEVYKRTGGIITVTGGAGSGKTVVAANLANILCKMGYQVLVIDMDTSGRGQSYINYDNYTTIHSGDTNVSGVKAALNSTSDKTGRFTEIIRSGFHLLGTGLRVDKAYPNDCLDATRVNKFLHGCQNSYNFIIIDLPFDAAIGKFSDMVNQADHVVLVEKLNNHGMMNFLLDMMSIEDEQLLEDLFDKAKVVFNMDDGCNSIFGKKVTKTTQALTALDIRLSELLGFQIDYSFAKMTVVDIIKYNREFEKYWFSKKYISDTKPGEDLFTNLLVNIFEI